MMPKHSGGQTVEAASVPPAGRITVEESFLDLVDELAHGDLETWRRVYATAQRSPAMRDAIGRAARLVDPDCASAGALWQLLVERIPTVVERVEPIFAARTSPGTREPARQRPRHPASRATPAPPPRKHRS